MTSKRKIFILDTSVLLYDKSSIHSFPKSEVVLPLVVLDELDRFKDRDGILGENARYINRFLDELREIGSLHEGVLIKEIDQTLRVEINSKGDVPAGLDPRLGDNKILSVAIDIAASNENIVVVTKDINFRVKCDALSISAEDYYKDRIVSSENQIYSGQIEVSMTDSQISEFYEKKSINIEDVDGYNFYPNQFVVAKSHTGSSLLGKVYNNKIIPLPNLSKDITSIDIKPRNKEQKFAIDLLARDDVPLVTMTGIAGSGKTFLTLVAGLSGIHSKKYDRLVITRSMQTVGKDIGYLPGTIKEKMDPWLSPVVDNFRHAFKDMTYFDMMREKGQIEVAPLSFIRGRTFNDAFIIVDESQNASIHELKTIITRVGENSKIVLLGDIEQIDTPYIDSLSNGLTIVVEKFKEANLAGHITLLKGERSRLATLASKLI